LTGEDQGEGEGEGEGENASSRNNLHPPLILPRFAGNLRKAKLKRQNDRAKFKNENIFAF